MLSSLVGHGTDEHVEIDYVRDFVRNMWNCRGFESGCEPETSCVPVAAAPAQFDEAGPRTVPPSGRIEERCAPGEARVRRRKVGRSRRPGVSAWSAPSVRRRTRLLRTASS